MYANITHYVFESCMKLKNDADWSACKNLTKLHEQLNHFAIVYFKCRIIMFNRTSARVEGLWNLDNHVDDKNHKHFTMHYELWKCINGRHLFRDQ